MPQILRSQSWLEVEAVAGEKRRGKRRGKRRDNGDVDSSSDGDGGSVSAATERRWGQRRWRQKRQGSGRKREKNKVITPSRVASQVKDLKI